MGSKLMALGLVKERRELTSHPVLTITVKITNGVQKGEGRTIFQNNFLSRLLWKQSPPLRIWSQFYYMLLVYKFRERLAYNNNKTEILLNFKLIWLSLPW